MKSHFHFRNIDELLKYAATIDSYRKHNRNISNEQLTYALESDPTYIENSNEVGKLTDWILKRKDLNEFMSEFHSEDLKLFLNVLLKGSKNPESPLYQKTINHFNTLKELRNATLNRRVDLKYESSKERATRLKSEMRDTFENPENEETAKEQYDIIYNNSKTGLRIVQPKTTLASCYFGKGTTWCTSTLSPNNMFESYTQDGDFYIVDDSITGEKFGIQPETEQFQNKVNSQANLPLFVLNYRKRDPEFLRVIESIYPYSFSDIAEMTESKIYNQSVIEGNKTILDYIKNYNEPVPENILEQLDEVDREKEKEKYYESLKAMVYSQREQIIENVPKTYLKSLLSENKIKYSLGEDSSEEIIKSVKEEDAARILSRIGYGSYGYNSDGTLHVNEYVNLRNMGLNFIGVKFGDITASFDCRGNNLTTLEGSPKKIGGNFYCDYNNLTTLQGAPEYIEGNFRCSDSQLKSLQGAPKYVGGSFHCEDNHLITLEGAPQTVGKGFYCRNNHLQTLQGSPSFIPDDFSCSMNQLTSLDGAPKTVKGDFYCDYNNLTTLQGAPEYIGINFRCNENKLISLEGVPIHIYGNFNCSYNQLQTLQGSPSIIEGSFDCSYNKLTTLEGAPAQVGDYIYDSHNDISFSESAHISKIYGAFGEKLPIEKSLMFEEKDGHLYYKQDIRDPNLAPDEPDFVGVQDTDELIEDQEKQNVETDLDTKNEHSAFAGIRDLNHLILGDNYG